jgi:3-hydroxyisobutyrate dehydrogenase-like beta-hydroxyacid dehydrogenase
MAAVVRVGVLGLGRMGGPIAARLAGRFDVLTFDPAIQGSARSATEAATGADVLVTVLPGAPEARAALLDDGALEALSPGALWLDLTSNDPTVVEELVDVAAAHGVASAAAPMAGGPAEARAGELRFFVAGPPSERDRVALVLDPLGRPYEPVVAERPSQAHLVKLLANALWFGQALAVTEALLVAGARGLPAETTRAILAQSAGGSVFLDRHAPLLLDGDDMSDFGLDRVVDELEAVERAAAAAGIPSGVLATVADIHREALAEFGPVDGELLGARLIERRAARRLGAF